MDKMMASQEEMKANNQEMMAGLKRLNATADTWLGETKAWQGVMHACLEKKVSTPEETEAVAEPQEVPEGATDEETIGVTEDRSRDLRLAIGCPQEVEDADQTRWSGEARACRHHRTANPSYRSCNTQGRTS
jgi:hypothetical protein